MMTLPNVFWMFIIMFGVIGSFRGWAKETLVIFSLLLAIAIDAVMFEFVPETRVILGPSFDGSPNILQFGVRATLILILAFFGYQTPNLQGFVGGKLAKDKLQDSLLGFVLGMVNGYMLVGTLWYYMHLASYPLAPYITAPPLDIATMEMTNLYLGYMPPLLLGIPNIYFAIIAAFVFVIIVFI